MPSPTVSTLNDENHSRSPSKPDLNATLSNANNPKRRALAEVSSNVKTRQTPTLSMKPWSGSPLKRSFTAAMESHDGMTYLKRRKLSGDEILSDVNKSRDSQFSTASFRPVLPATANNNTFSSIPDTDAPSPSPTEPNTPSDKGSTSSHDDNSSTERRSFSSLINYDASSQPQSHAIWKSVSNAETLRLQLKVAMFKIRTGQVAVPFAELKVPDSQPRTQVSESGAYDQEAVERAVEELRREAQARLSKTTPKLMPGPVLKPTAYSSRKIYAIDLINSPSQPASADMSPELPVAHPVEVGTPHRYTQQLSSPSGSVGRFGRSAEQELTSSVVKGRVAEGLLGLRNAA